MKKIALQLTATRPPLALALVPSGSSEAAALAQITPGPPGPSGAGYTHTQVGASTSWTINHNLGVRPNVDIANSGGQKVNADVLHTSLNQVVISFVTPTAGTARLT